MIIAWMAKVELDALPTTIRFKERQIFEGKASEADSENPIRAKNLRSMLEFQEGLRRGPG